MRKQLGHWGKGKDEREEDDENPLLFTKMLFIEILYLNLVWTEMQCGIMLWLDCIIDLKGNDDHPLDGTKIFQSTRT